MTWERVCDDLGEGMLCEVLPAFLVAGSSTFTTTFLGVKSTPTSAGVSVSIGFFLAYE